MYKRKRINYNRNYGRRPSTAGRPYQRAFKRVRRTYIPRTMPSTGTVSTRRRFNASNLRGASLMNTKHYVTLVYADETNIASGAAHEWSCNGLFDPNITGIGHQPRGFDQLMVLYDHYTVLGAKCTAICATSVSGVHALTVEDQAGATYSQFSDVGENRMLQAWRLSKGTANTQDVIEMVGKWSPRQYFSKDPLDDDRQAGTAAANPAEQAYFSYANGTGAAITVYIRIEYFVCFHEPKEPAES